MVYYTATEFGDLTHFTATECGDLSYIYFISFPLLIEFGDLVYVETYFTTTGDLVYYSATEFVDLVYFKQQQTI